MPYQVETYGELHPHLNQEWLLTNGTGSFAMSTVVGCNTRRYHGLLVASTNPPVGRVMALSRLAESVAIDDQATPVELSANFFQSLMIPRGDRYLRRFELYHTAKFHYDADGVRITKEVLLVWGKPIVGVRYTVDTGKHSRVQLRLQPFVALRDFHALPRRDGREYDLLHSDRRVSVAQRDLRLVMQTDQGRFESRPDWWYEHTYPIESERGMEDREDLFTPGTFCLDVVKSGEVTLWAGLGQQLDALNFERERERVLQHNGVPEMPTQTQDRLARAAAQFVARRNRAGDAPGATIMAGFPWFADWGRDTMIALPGILLTTGRLKEAGQVLSVFASHVSEGMVPNYFDDYSSEPSYNTVDASLWFIHAVHLYMKKSRDNDLYESLLLPACREIIEGYRDGTRFGIRMDPLDGLITAGDRQTQLTWMDAKVGEIAFTPRHGKAVEINALWYNALRLLGENALADAVRESFLRAFWISPYRGLADVVNSEMRDTSIRPNQIFAASLPHSPLDVERRRAVVEIVRRELLTPFGLRTLAANDPGYKGHYRGGPFERDSAYHNGTVWPWPIGAFLDAYLNSHDRTPQVVAQARAWLKPLVDSLESGCLGSISECFEGDSPHRPVAAPAQAWSVAEVLRLAVELEM